MKKLWGGRFQEEMQALAWQFNSSFSFDQRLASMDIWASIAWAKSLFKAELISKEELRQIIGGLHAILAECRSGKFQSQTDAEDIHSAVELRLTEMIGSAGEKLHTGRSRNDQVATDLALWIMQACDQITQDLTHLMAAILQRAEIDMGLIINGYTHLRPAQPILLSHWWLSHFWPLARDRQRLEQTRQWAAVLPLGSGALAGCAFPVDREFLARQLGFESISANSLDAVANRDGAAEFLFCASLSAVHLSGLAEALILFSTHEFGYFELAEAYSGGSSLMPQKKNPDVLELTRGKTGTLIGRLAGLLATLKGLPSAYDKDLQEDKAPLFEAYDALHLMLPVMQGVLESLRVHPEHLQAKLEPAMLATDLADYLVRRGQPFRQAHAIAGQAVRLAESKGIALQELPLEELQALSALFDADVREVFDFKASINRRSLPGGSGEEAVREQMQLARREIGRD